MIDKIFNIFSQFNEYIFVLIILMSVFYCFCIYTNLNINKSRILFPLLYDLTYKQTLKLAVLIFKYSFLLYIIFSNYEFNFRVILLFVLLDTIYNLVNYDVIGVLIDYINSFGIFIILLYLDILAEYIVNVSNNIEYKIVYICGIIFIILYSICIFIIKLLKLKKVKR